MNQTKRWSLLRLALAALGLSTLMADGGLREDEIDCEQAVAYLQQCCPGFSRSETLQCEYSDGCGVTEPAISITESQCILAEGCAQIVASGICQRAENLASPMIAPGTGGATVSTGTFGGGSTTPPTVCP